MAGARAERRDDQQGQQQGREREHRVHHAHHEVIEAPSDVAGGQSNRDAEQQPERDRPEAEPQRGACPDKCPTQEIAPVLIGPKQEARARRLQAVQHVLLGRGIRHDPRRRHAHGEDDGQDRAAHSERRR